MKEQKNIESISLNFVFFCLIFFMIKPLRSESFQETNSSSKAANFNQVKSVPANEFNEDVKVMAQLMACGAAIGITVHSIKSNFYTQSTLEDLFFIPVSGVIGALATFKPALWLTILARAGSGAKLTAEELKKPMIVAGSFPCLLMLAAKFLISKDSTISDDELADRDKLYKIYTVGILSTLMSMAGLFGFTFLERLQKKEIS